MISKADRFGGGASRIAEELCALLEAHGHTAHHFVAKAKAPRTFTRLIYGSRPTAKIMRALHYGTQRIGLQELIPWEYFITWLRKTSRKYDLVHFHDLSSAISPLTVYLMSCRLPTVWTFHDCAAFTGGCIFPFECRRFEENCGSCPQLNSWPLSFSKGVDCTAFMLRLKHRILANDNISVIAPSEWMAKTAARAGLKRSRLAIIPYGIDTSLYKPRDKKGVRRELGLPVDRSIVLVSAGNISDVRKGTTYSLQAIRRIREELKPFVLVVGRMDEETRRQFSGVEFRETGFLADDRMKAQYFAAADVFLFCPIDDNLPLTILEAMATSTPMVGFATGGIPELFQNEVAGYLAPKRDVDGVVRGLRLALAAHKAVDWGRMARRRVEAAYQHDSFLHQHLRFFEEAISSFRSRT